ncbi:hypothetical protein CQA86_32760, partial [Klebsiella pneumoniae]
TLRDDFQEACCWPSSPVYTVGQLDLFEGFAPPLRRTLRDDFQEACCWPSSPVYTVGQLDLFEGFAPPL